MTPPRTASAAAGGVMPARQLAFSTLGTPLVDTTFVIVDLETTGLSPERDAITEIGAVKARGGEVLGELATFVDPGAPIPPAITAITGISDAMVRGAPPLDVVLPSVMEFLDGGVFVAHNASFDLAFLRTAASRLYGEAFSPEVVDTVRLARRVLAGELRSFRLASVAAHLGARTTPNHRALADARATLDVLHGLIERAGSHGATTLGELQELTRSRSHRAYRRRSLIAGAPAEPGVYRFLGEDGEVLYVGKASRLDRRLSSYFGPDTRRRVADLVRATAEVQWTTTPTPLEAEIRELRAIHAHRPRFNRRSTRPERSVHLAMTDEAFPRLSLVKTPGRGHLWTLGPLPDRATAECVAESVAAASGLRTCTTRLRRRQDHPSCALKDLGRCAAPCDGTVDAEAYTGIVDAAHDHLEDPGPLLAGLETRMRAAAADERYERAREVREQLHTTARAVWAVRRHDALRAVPRLVARARCASGTEVVLVRGGALVGTAVLAGDAPDAQAAEQAAALESAAGPVGEPTREEVALLWRWLDGTDVRLVEADGALSTPLAGGADLAGLVAQARHLTSRSRHDRNELDRAKVRRRPPVADRVS